MNILEKQLDVDARLTASQKRYTALIEAANDQHLATETFIRNNGDYARSEQGQVVLAEYRDKELKLQAVLDAEKQINESLVDELAGLVHEFHNPDLLAQYKLMDECKARLSALEQALEKAEEPAVVVVDTVSPLREELQTSLVNKALGQNVDKELDRLEKAIIKAENTDAAANSDALAAQAMHSATVQGLESKIATERVKLAELQDYCQFIKLSLLRDKAAVTSELYADAAQTTITELFRLLALDAEITRLDKQNRNSGMLPGNLWEICLPRAKTPTPKQTFGGTGGHLINRSKVGIDFTGAANQLRGELLAEGFR